MPTEVVKQRAQATPGRGAKYVAYRTYAKEGLKGFYRGYFSTVARDVPFSTLEFPLWEWFKALVAKRTQRAPTPLESALCGSGPVFT